ncbi:MAG: dihydroneopterin aldolase [Peptococcaceae bacterium]|jgi:dihydroneopterin aldolase|nr:dihydroneopterin aldolase [Peptococcaceae bacterium]
MIPKGAEACDQLILKGMRFYGFHGNRADEKQVGQWFEIDVTAFADLTEAAASDDLERGLNYSTLYKGIKAITEGPSLNLIEALAGKIMDFCLSQPEVLGARVLVKKPQAPLKGPLEYAGAQMERFKRPPAGTPDAGAGP